MKIDLDKAELAYLSRAIFRQRMDKPDDEPELAAQLDPKISVARDRSEWDSEEKWENSRARAALDRHTQP